MNKLIAIVCLTCVVASATCSAQSSGGSALEREDTGTSDLARVEDLGYETIRFYTRNSKPENIKSYAFSPNGRYLALSFDRDNLGARSGLSIVDLEQKQLTKTTGHYSFYSMAFDSNSQRVLALGGYAGLQVYDLTTNSLREIRNPRYTAGKIGIDIEEHNGKLVISRVLRDFNPTIGDQIKVGDELLAINEGARPTLYDDRREWQTLVGKPSKKVLEIMAGLPNTWVQLRLSRRGLSEPNDIVVQRQWPVGHDHALPKHGKQLTMSDARGVTLMRSADTLECVSFVSDRDLKSNGQYAISPNAKLFASLSFVSGNNKRFGLEVHSLQSGEIVSSSLFDANTFRDLKFSPDSRQVLAGTRDSIEIFDTVTEKWLEPVVLTPKDDADAGRLVTRRIPLGLGFPGDFFMTANEVMFDKPAALATFDVSPSGVLAIGSEDGRLVIASLETKGITAEMGERILGGVPEMVEFSPDGKHLVGFAKGILHIFDIVDGSRSVNSERLSSLPR